MGEVGKEVGQNKPCVKTRGGGESDTLSKYGIKGYPKRVFRGGKKKQVERKRRSSPDVSGDGRRTSPYQQRGGETLLDLKTNWESSFHSEGKGRMKIWRNVGCWDDRKRSEKKNTGACVGGLGDFCTSIRMRRPSQNR